MNIGISSLYLKTLGGGEQYIFSIASCLLARHKVTLFTDTPGIVVEAEQRFGYPLTGLSTENDVLTHGATIPRLLRTLRLDALIHVGDGSLPFSFAKKNYYIIQFPTPWATHGGVLERLKESRITKILCYSSYVQSYIEKSIKAPVVVLPPSIRMQEYTVGEKEPFILSVGRFTQGMNTKNQRIMIQAMKALLSQGVKGWKLVLAGGMLPEDHAFVESLQKEAAGFPIEIQVNVPRTMLLSLFRKASIYWHAAGFGVDINTHPEQVEHFGITTVEAMASGAVPLVYPAGGQLEIVDDGLNGYYWKDIPELVNKTSTLIHKESERTRLMHTARIKADIFDISHFSQKVIETIG